MKKNGFYILLISLVLLLLALAGNQYLTDDNSVSNIFYRTALETSKRELALHNDLIGKSIWDPNPGNNDQFDNIKGDVQKIVVSLLDKEQNLNNYQGTVIDAIDFYAGLMDTTSFLENVQLILSTKERFEKLNSYAHKYYKDVIELHVDSSNVFSQLYSLSDRGAVVMLLNQRNICLYAYYLERDNNRKIYENSAVIFRLLRNLNEEKI